MKTRLFVFLIVLGGATVKLYGEAATTQGAGKEYTQKDFYREALAFDRSQLVDVYQSSGKKDPKWDAAATAALELLARRTAQNSTEITATPCMYGEARVRSAEEHAAAKAAIDLGCDDPMVLYLEGSSAMAEGRFDDGRKTLSAARAGLMTSKYPALIRAAALFDIWRNVDDDKALAKDRAGVEAMCRQIGQEKYPNGAAERRAAQWIYWLISANGLRETAEALNRLEKAPGFDPWIANELTANVEIDLAWQSRGSRWAEETTAEQMGGFEAHLTKAAEAARKAYSLRPELPESAASMETISKGTGNAEDAKLWFRRAISAQLDYEPAYGALLAALQPRWGGSVDESIELANEFAQSKRFDTTVPLHYINALAAVAADKYGGKKDIFKDRTVHDTAVRILKTYVDQPDSPASDYCRSCLVALHVLNKDMDNAKAEMDSIRGEPDDDAFQLFGLYAQMACDDVCLATVDKKGVADFKRASGRHFYRNASKFLQAILDKDKPQGPALDTIQRLKRGTDLMVKFGGGEKISLTDDSARGFWVSQTKYAVGPNGIETRLGEAFNIVNRFEMPDRHYDLHLRYDFLDPDSSRSQNVVLVWGGNMSWIGWSLTMPGMSKTIQAQAPVTEEADTELKELAAPIGASNVVEIAYADDVPRVTINGVRVALDFGDKTVLKKFKPRNWLYLRVNGAVRVSEFTLHHTTKAEEPDPNHL